MTPTRDSPSANLRRRGLEIVERAVRRLRDTARLVPACRTTRPSPGSSRSHVTTSGRRWRRCTASRRPFRRRCELAPPADRYVEMIEAASKQIAELLDELSLAARIEGGRYDPRRARGGHARARAGGGGAARCGSRPRLGRGARSCTPTSSRSTAACPRSCRRRFGTAASTRSTSSCAGKEIRRLAGDGLVGEGRARAGPARPRRGGGGARARRRSAGRSSVSGETLTMQLAIAARARRARGRCGSAPRTARARRRRSSRRPPAPACRRRAAASSSPGPPQRWQTACSLSTSSARQSSSGIAPNGQAAEVLIEAGRDDARAALDERSMTSTISGAKNCTSSMPTAS